MTDGVVSVAPDVAALLGPLVTARLRQQRSDMVCCVCRTMIDVASGDDASVVLEQHDNVARVVFAHTSCMASQVIGDVHPMFTADAERVEVVTAAVVLPTLDGPRPWLFIQQRGGQRILTPTGDEIDPYLSEFLARGWEILGALGRPAPDVATARLMLYPGGWGTLTADDEVLLDQMPPLPSAWVELVEAYGWVDVGVGDFGLVRRRPETVKPSAFMNAARRGGLVAGRVPARVSHSLPEPELDPVTADLGAALNEISVVRARPGATDPFSTAPDVVTWARPPQLYLVDVASGFAGLWIDLDDPNRNRAAAIIAALEREGLSRRRSLYDDGYFALGPPGWGALVWRSQILVLGGKVEGGTVQRKLLFQQLGTDPDWYRDIQQASSMAIFVGNLCRSPTLRLIENAMADGEVLACVVTAMMA